MTIKALVIIIYVHCLLLVISAYETPNDQERANKGRGYYPGQQQYDSSTGRARDDQFNRPQQGRGFYDFSEQGSQQRPDKTRGTEKLYRDQGRPFFQFGKPKNQFGRPEGVGDWTRKPGQQQKQQVQYVYNLQTNTGVPGSSKQHSGFRMLAKLTWANVNDDQCLLKITEIKVGEIRNKPLQDPSTISNDFGSTIDLINAEGRQQDKLRLPVKFTCNRGNVHNLVFDAEDEPWSMNIKRGILNLFRVSIHERSPGARDSESFNKDNVEPEDREEQEQDDDIVEPLTHVDRMRKQSNDFFRTMEENVEGDCETDYNVMKLFPVQGGRHDIYNVTKSINLKSCRRRPVLKYNFRFSERCPGEESSSSEHCENSKRSTSEEQMLKPTSYATYTLIGNRNQFVITNAEFKSQYTFTLFNEKSDNIVTYVNQKIDMIKSNGGHHTRIEEPKNPVRSKTGNIYSMEWDLADEKQRMHDQAEPVRRLTATHDFHARADRAKFLLSQLAQKLFEQSSGRQRGRADFEENRMSEEPTDLLRKFATLLRTCTSHELGQVSEFASQPMKSSGNRENDDLNLMHSLYPNLLAVCGTKACLKHLVDFIKQNRYSTPAALSALKELFKTQTPSTDMINELMKLTNEEGRGGQQQQQHLPYFLKQSAWLTLGSLMNALCNNRRDKWATELFHGQKPCPKQLKQRFIQVVAEKLQSSQKWEDQLIYVKTLSNAGLGSSAPLLEKIIHGKHERISPMLRSAAVYALKKLPKSKVQKILTPIVTSFKEPTNLRVSAANILLQKNPDRSTIEQLVNLVKNDKNLELASFLYTAIKALSKSTNPCEKQTAKDAHLAIQRVRRFKPGCLHASKLRRITLHDPWQNAGLDFEMTSSFSNATNQQMAPPQHLALNVHSHFFGQWYKNLFSLGLVSNDVQHAFDRAYDLFGRRISGKSGKSGTGSGSGGGGWSLTDIWSRGFGGGSKKQDDDNDNMHDMFSHFTDEHGGPENGRRQAKGLIYLKYLDQNLGFLPISSEMIQSGLAHLLPKFKQLENRLKEGVPVDFAKAAVLQQQTYKIPTSAGVPFTVKAEGPALVHLRGRLQAGKASASSSPNQMKAFKVVADMEYNFDVNLLVENEIWTPIVNHGLRVDHRLKYFQPIKTAITVDFSKDPTTAQLMIRQPTEKFDLIKLETAPITYTNVWLKFVKNLDHPMEKVVPGEELSKTKYKVNKCFEEFVTGSKMCLKGEMHQMMIDVSGNTPAVPLSGRNKLVLSVEPTSDSREDVVINLSAKLFKPASQRDSAASDASRNSGLPPPGSTFQRDFSPSQQRHGRDREEEEGGNEDQLGEWSSSQGNGGNQLVSKLHAEGQSPSRRFAFEAKHLMDPRGGGSKFQLKFMKESARSREPYVVCLDSDYQCQKCGTTQGDTSVKCTSFDMRLNWGSSCNSNKFIAARLEPTGQSSMDGNDDDSSFDTTELYEPGCDDENRCPLSAKRRRAYSQLDTSTERGTTKAPRFRLDIAYNNVPVSMKNATNKLYQMLKHRYYPQMDVAQVQVKNPDKRITAWIHVDPKNPEQSDISVKMPGENSTFINVPTPMGLLFCTSQSTQSTKISPRRKPFPSFPRKPEIDEESRKRGEYEEEEEEQEEPEEEMYEKPGWYKKAGGTNEDFSQGPSAYEKRRGSKRPMAKKTEYGYEKRRGEWPDKFDKDMKKYEKSPFGKKGPYSEKYDESPEDAEQCPFSGKGRKQDDSYEPSQEKYEDYTSLDKEGFRKGRDDMYKKRYGKREDQFEKRDYDFSDPNDPYGRYQKKSTDKNMYPDEEDHEDYESSSRGGDDDEEEEEDQYDRDQDQNERYTTTTDNEDEDSNFDKSGDKLSKGLNKKGKGHGHLSIKRHIYDKEDYDWYETCKDGDKAQGGKPCTCKNRPPDNIDKDEDEEFDQYPEDQYEKRYTRVDQDQPDKYQDTDHYTQRIVKPTCQSGYEEGCAKRSRDQFGYGKTGQKKRSQFGIHEKSRQENEYYNRQGGGGWLGDWDTKDDEEEEQEDDWSKRQPIRKDQYEKPSKAWMSDDDQEENDEDDDHREPESRDQEKRGNSWTSNWKRMTKKWFGNENDEQDNENDMKKGPAKKNPYKSHDSYNQDEPGQSWESDFTEGMDDDDDDDPEHDDDDPQESYKDQTGALHPENYYPQSSKNNKDQQYGKKKPEAEKEKAKGEPSTKKEPGTSGTICTANEKGVKTLDNVQFPFPLPQCFEILTRDCSPERQFAVMMRKADEKEGTKEIMVLTRGHKLLIKPNVEGQQQQQQNQQGQNIMLGGKKYIIQEDVDLYKPGEKLIRMSQDNGKVNVEITKVGLKVDFDGTTINIEFPNDVAKKQCGLCGQSTEEKSTSKEKQWPNTQDPTYLRDLYMRYVIKDARCQGTAPGMGAQEQQSYYGKQQQMTTGQREQQQPAGTLKHKPEKSGLTEGDVMKRRQEEYLKKQQEQQRKGIKEEGEEAEEEYPEEEEESGFESGEEEQYKKKGGKVVPPVRAHAVLESGDQICISIVPLHKCSRGSYAEREVQRPVGYFCVSRSDPRSSQMKQQADTNQAIRGLERLTPSKTKTETFPTRCIGE